MSSRINPSYNLGLKAEVCLRVDTESGVIFPRPKGRGMNAAECIKMQESKFHIRIQNFTFWIVILIFAFCILDFSYAAPCYGTRMPQKRKFFAGLESYTLFKRHQEKDYGKLRSMQYFVLLSYGVYDWLSIDLKGGTGNIKQHPADRAEIDYSYNFAGGYGLRLGLYDNNDTKMVFGFQHISVHPKSTRLEDGRHKAIVDDWQVSILLSQDFGKATPYLGTRWSRLDYIHRIDDYRKRVMSDLTKSVGLIFGLDFTLTDKIWFNLEASFLDSEAFAFSINFAL
jgi:hypothetical protein